MDQRRGDALLHTSAYRVLYGDTDAGGVVYYGAYMRLLELGRTEFLREVVGVSYGELVDQGLIFPVVELRCRYHAPARYDDLLKIDTWIEEVTGATVRFAYTIRRAGLAGPLLTGHTINAAVNPSGRPVRIPRDLALRLRGVVRKP